DLEGRGPGRDLVRSGGVADATRDHEVAPRRDIRDDEPPVRAGQGYPVQLGHHHHGARDRMPRAVRDDPGEAVARSSSSPPGEGAASALWTIALSDSSWL